MSLEGLSKNVRRYMKLQKLSIPQLAEKSELGTATLSNILNEKTTPNSSTLIKISKALGVSFPELLAEIPNLKTLRFRTKSKLTAREVAERDQLEIDSAIWLKNYVDLEELTGTKSVYKFDKITANDPKEAAKEIRKIWNIETDEPIYDLVSLIEDAGIKLYLNDFNFQKTFGLSVNKEDGGPAIIVNNNEAISVERKLFTIAHELGHLILHKSSYDGEVAEENKTEEDQADMFAGELLMPQEAFSKQWEAHCGISWIDAVLQIKQYFGVSYKTVLYRLNSLIGSRYRPGYLYTEFSKLYYQKYKHDLKNHYEPNSIADITPAKDEPEKLSSFNFTEERFERLVRQAYEQEKISISRAAEILNLSAEEMRERVAEWL
ncbi:MAG: ImmA/IrrE family metallo-endopeptidase [Spirochaetaceae bacterium]|nr:ImmA/IrrE family metallo-endopeptidase [Spirochaetaceae bacterium]